MNMTSCRNYQHQIVDLRCENRESRIQSSTHQIVRNCCKLQKMDGDVCVRMFQAVDRNNLEGVLACIDYGVNINSKDPNGQTALIVAAERGYYEIVAQLLHYKIDIDAQDYDGWTALIAASKEGHDSIVALLLRYGAKTNVSDLSTWTPLVWASYKGHYDVVRHLLQNGADPNKCGQHDMTALIWASGRGHFKVVEELIMYGAKTDVSDKYCTPAMVWAARKGHSRVIKTLIDNGANYNTSDAYGRTPLIMSAKGGFSDAVMLLLERHININAVDQDGRSGLSWSAKKGDNDNVIKFIQKGAFLNILDKNGATPLVLAAIEGHTDVVKTLILAHADIEIKKKDGKTALYVAAENSHGEVFKELLKAGANTGVTNKKGDTILHIAVQNQYPVLCKIILNDINNHGLLHQQNKAGYTPYSIDMNSKHPILPGLFSENQLNQNEYEKMDALVQQQMVTTTFGEFLVEPSLSVPLTIGIYSRWGAGKSKFLQQIMEFLDNFKEQAPIEPFTITMPSVLLCIIFAITCGLIMWPLASWHAGIAVAICVTIVSIMILSSARVGLVSTNEKLHKYGITATNTLKRLSWFLRLVYCVPPSIEDVRHFLPVNVITIDLSCCVFVGDNPTTSLVNFTQALNNAVEESIGMFIPRLYRIFQAGPYREQSGAFQRLRSQWKISCCCIPSFAITMLVVVCLWTGISLFGSYITEGDRTDAGIGIMIICLCVVGVALVINIIRFCIMIYCLLLPMKKRVKILSTQAGMQEDTFLTVLKQELDLFIDMLECIDGFAKRQTRIIIKLDLIESLEQQKNLSLINAINLLVTEPGHPFVLILCADPRLLIKAVDQTVAFLPGPMINPREYLRNLIDLPFYLNDSRRNNYTGLIPMDMRHQLEEQRALEYDQVELEWDGDGEILVSTLESIKKNETSHAQSRHLTPIAPRTVRFPSTESFNSKTGVNIMENISHLLRSNESGTLTDVRRVMNIVSLNGRILTKSELNFKWPRLAVWVCFCDGWPHKASWITLLCLDNALEIPDSMSIKNVYLVLGFCMPNVNEVDTASESSSTYFDTFLSTHKPPLNVGDVRLFASSMFYIDPTIRKLMVDYLTTMKNNGITKSTSFINNKPNSNRSIGPLSPASSSKFTWRPSIDDVGLSRMAVEDIASKLISIEGMENTYLPLYKTRVYDNNINGRVLMHCDLNDLREAMQMKFGDWQLFKAWITESREKDSLVRNVDKASSYRSSSRNLSYGECSQTESIPDSPKVSYTSMQKNNRLPALSESSPSNMPYASHRSSPQQKRKTPTYRRVASDNYNKIIPYDTENSTLLKDQHKDPNWQRSADSGFASADVDPNNKISINHQTETTIPAQFNGNAKRHINGSGKVLKNVIQKSSLDQLPRYKDLYKDTWNSKQTMNSNHIYKAPNDIILSSGSSEYVAIDIDDKSTWRFATISDTDGNFSDINETSNEDFDASTLKKEHAPSLLEMPLPPLSMLSDSDSDINPPKDFADERDENDNSKSASIKTAQRKKGFQNKRLKGMSNYVDLSLTEQERLLTEKNLTNSEPNVKIIRGSRSSLKKALSSDSCHKKRKHNIVNAESNGFSQGLTRQDAKS